MTNFNRIVCSLALFAGLSTPFLAHADCYASIHNQSAKPWSFEFETFYGRHVQFIGIDCKGGFPCTINPYKRVEIIYPIDSNGQVHIKDHIGVEKIFSYSIRHDCAYIDHKGSTGSITLNEPSRGSIQVNRSGEHW